MKVGAYIQSIDEGVVGRIKSMVPPVYIELNYIIIFGGKVNTKGCGRDNIKHYHRIYQKIS